MAMFRAGFLLAALLLCGCAGVSVTPDQLRSIRRVAVISIVGEKFAVHKFTLNPFERNPKFIPIAAWGIDPFVVKKVGSVLAGRFEVRPLAYDAYAANANDVAVKIAENVRAQSGATDIDAYVIVSTGLVDMQTAGRRERYSGLGITDHGQVLVPKIELYALYDMTVVDAHDLSVVTSTQSVFGGPSLGGRAWREVDESWMPATLDAAKNPRLKGAVTELLDRTLPATIESLKLLQ